MPPPKEPSRLAVFPRTLRARLFAPIKVPAWLVILYGLYRGIPDLLGETEWWINAARDAGGEIGLAAAVIGSPFFGPALVLGGILWLIFVGEPKRGVLRAHWWSYVGWSLVVLLAAVVLITGTFGYAVSILGPRNINSEQIARFVSAARLPPGTTYTVAVEADITCPDCETYGDRLVEVIGRAQGWIAGSKGVIAGPSLRAPTGLAVLYSGTVTPAIKHLCAAFNAAQIKYDLIVQRSAPFQPAPDVQLTVMPKVPD